MKNLLLFVFFWSSLSVSLSQNPTYQQKLYYSCKVWGFVKYYHLAVSTCQVDWDSVLISKLPFIKNAVTNNEFNDVLASMLSAAGPMAIATTPSPDTLPPELKRNLNFGWINDTVLRNDIKVILDTIKNNFRPHSICWVNDTAASNGWLAFPHDNPIIDSNTYTNYPSEFTRLLLLYKYWNIISYFNPYNYILDLPWDSTFLDNVISMSSASDYTVFFKTIKKLAAGCQDAHAEALTTSSKKTLFGYYAPRLVLRFSQNNYIVVKSGYSNLSKGDILVSVDGKTTDQWEDSLRPYISAGNQAVFRRFMCQNLLNGVQESPIQIVFKDSAGNDHDLITKRYYQIYNPWFLGYYPNDTLGIATWKKWNCNVGYVNMKNLDYDEVADMYSELKNTTTIIFDLRNYPKATAWDIADYMYPNRICFSKMTEPCTSYPGTYSWFYDSLGYNGSTNSYSGKVIILCNQETQSMAEYSCMILGAMPDHVIIGSQTAGADGNITRFNLSQDIETGFTSLGVYYPNGDSTQRIGIVPDSLVNITQDGVRQGRDEVLEKALQVADCLVPMLSVDPTTQNVAATAGTTVFSVTSNTNWSVTSEADWCTITSSGSGNGMITASYNASNSLVPRVATMTISASEGGSIIVTLIQAEALAITPSTHNVLASPAGTVTFNVTSNAPWTAISDQTWCEVTPTGTVNQPILANYTENSSISSRIANITIAINDLISVVVSLNQTAGLPTLIVSPLNQNVPATPVGLTTFSVTSNTGWNVTSDQSWCSVTPSGNGNGTISAGYEENTSDQSRSAFIHVTVKGLPEQIVTINQTKSSIGVGENQDISYRIYPNPSTGLFSIVCPYGDKSALDVIVQDLQGKIILGKHCIGEKEYGIDLSSTPQGIYHIIIKTNTSLYVRKISIIK